MTTDFAIVGLGSWGLSVLERTVSRARSGTRRVRVHVIQPGPAGGGAYSTNQPDYLVLNNACGQLSLYASPEPDHEPRYALGLYEWATREGYQWHGYECNKQGRGRPIEPTDYLPRRLMGEYLSWFYDALVASAPDNLEVVRHDAAAVDISAEVGGRERVTLDNGDELHVAHVILTSGHTWNEEEPTAPGVVPFRRPYPVAWFNETTPAGTPIGLAGMGLVGFDLVAALTIGRGGHFDEDGSRMRYRRSGQEPSIYLYSRSGMPCCVKSAQGIDPTGDYQAAVCTAEVFDSLRSGTRGGRRQIDFRQDLLPLLFAEMQVRYHTQAALLRDGSATSAAVWTGLRTAWQEGTFDKATDDLADVYGAFVPDEHLFPGRPQYASSREYEAEVYEMVATDLDDALMPGGSPVKAAQEVTRILRDQLRSVIEYGGLSLESYLDFQSNIRGRINRIEAGPPPLRSQQLLALMDAGVVRIPFGPSPELTTTADGRIAVRSTRFDRPHAATLTTVVRSHLDMPTLPRSASPLLNRLYSKGRLTQLRYGDTPVGSVAISEDFHPYDVEGRVQEGLSLLGVLTEGVRYFTHYLPSPRSRLRAVIDAQACVDSILS